MYDPIIYKIVIAKFDNIQYTNPVLLFTADTIRINP